MAEYQVTWISAECDQVIRVKFESRIDLKRDDMVNLKVRRSPARRTASEPPQMGGPDRRPFR